MNAEGQQQQYESPFSSESLWRESAFSLPPPSKAAAGPTTSQNNLFHDANLELLEQADNLLLPFVNIHDDHHGDGDGNGIGDKLGGFEEFDIGFADLDSYQFGRLEGLSPPETSVGCDSESCGASEGFDPRARQRSDEQGEGQVEQEQEQEQDLWELALALPSEGPKLRTWEGFIAEEKGGVYKEENGGVYISEAGANAFDEVLERHAVGHGGEGGDVLQSAFFLKCLALLGEGRGSALFQWDERGSFKQTLEKVRLSGFSLEAAESAVQELGDAGRGLVELRTFVDKTYAAKSPLPARVALARCVQVVLEVLEQVLTTKTAGARSALQLVDCFKVPGMVLRELQELVRVSDSARSNIKVMRAIYGRVQRMTEACSPHLDIHLDILNRVSHPWVQSVSRRVGLSQVEHLVDDSAEDEDEVGGLVSTNDLGRIDELGSSLSILEHSYPDHPLLGSTAWVVEQPELEHCFVHVDAGRILEKAQRYEADLLSAIRKYDTGEKPVAISSSRQEATSLDNESMAWENNDMQQKYFTAIGQRFAQSPSQDHGLVDESPEQLRVLVAAAVNDTPSKLHTVNESMTADLAEVENDRSLLRPLRPFFHAQSRLLNGTVLRLLFRRHKLRDHLRLQHSFHLFGNGVFTHRLSTALFDADSSSAERRRGEVIGGSGGSLGLRLDARSKWPPGGSELRLALMGILSESYYAHSSEEKVERGGQGNELPGGLSFSIRELEEEEIEKILDPHSVFALDFLRLSYEAPKPLDVVFTEAGMNKYDEVFRFLLRLIRMIHVTTAMKMLVALRNTRDNSIRAFAVEAHHFVANLAGYIFDVGIGLPWTRLATQLDAIEEDLTVEDRERTYGSTVKIGLEGLKKLHDGMLESIRTRLLLRQKQVRIKDVLDNIFLRILDVWRRIQADKQSRATAVGRDDLDGMRGDVRNLLNLLGELARKAGRRAVTGKAAEEKQDMEAVDMLRLRLDLTGFYSHTKEV